jgi:hypothetical protein
MIRIFQPELLSWLFNDAISIETIEASDRMVKQYVEVGWMTIGKPEVFGYNLPQCYFVHHKSLMTWTRIETSRIDK